MKTLHRPTIHDVARLSASSIATVSRVLNNTDYPVTEQTKQKILEAAKQLDYTPNALGQALKNGSSFEIGVVVPSLLNPFYAELISGIEKICYEKGYTPVFCSSNNNAAKEQQHLNFFLQMRMAGVIVSKLGKNTSCLNRILRSSIPVVLFDQPIKHPLCDSVTYNFFEAGKMAAEHLLSCGHRKIAFFTLPFDRKSRIARYEGFLSALEKAGVKFEPEYLFITDEDPGDDGALHQFSHGNNLVHQFIAESGATAVAAINDLVALGAMNELVKNGFRVPEDVSVIGFDDIMFASMTSPPLTTIKQPSFEMGRLAANALIKKIEFGADTHNAVELQPVLIERGSVCKIK